jgi:hypothetical protein
MTKAGIGHFRREVRKSPVGLLLFIDEVQPAQPFVFAAVRPKRSIARPQPGDIAIFIPSIQHCLDLAKKIVGQR